MIIFLIIVCLWLTIGIIGIINSKKNRIDFEMMIFLAFSIFIPILAKNLLF